jgi:sugar phosphate permease
MWTRVNAAGPRIGTRPTVVRYLVLAMLALAAASAYLTRHALAVANNTIQTQLGITPDQMGYVLAAFSLSYSLSQIPAGWLGERLGTRSTLASMSVLWSLCTVWTAAVGSYAPLWLLRFLYGVAQAGLVPITALAIKDWFPLGRRGVASAVIGASMSMGGAVAMEVTGNLMRRFDWRDVFRLYSLVGVAWAVVFYLVFRTKPSEHPWVNQAERDLILVGAEAKEVETPQPASEDTSPSARPLLVVAMLTSLSLWAICVQSAFRAGGYILYSNWLPDILEKRYGLTPHQAGRLTAAPLVAVVVGATAGGFLVDLLLKRTGSKWVSRSGVGFAALTLGAVTTFTAAWTPSPNTFVAVLTLGAMIAGFASPAAWTATMDVGGKHTAVVVGVMNMAGGASLLVQIIAGYMVGDIHRSGGDWNQVVYFFAGIYFIAGVAWLFVNPNRMLMEG